MEPTVLSVFLYASLTALATGLGALPLYLMRDVPDRWVGLGNAVAAGLMLSASFNLVFEGIRYGMPRTMIGVLLGLGGIVLSRKLLPKEKVPSVGDLAGAGAIKAVLIVGVMTVHSFAEGIGVGVSFGETSEFGAFISLAIAVPTFRKVLPSPLFWFRAARPSGRPPCGASFQAFPSL